MKQGQEALEHEERIVPTAVTTHLLLAGADAQCTAWHLLTGCSQKWGLQEPEENVGVG